MRKAVVGGAVLALLAIPGWAVATPSFTTQAKGVLYAIGCPTSTVCYAVGSRKGVGIVDTLHSGTQVSSRQVKSQAIFRSISCAPGGTCELVGEGTVQSLSQGKLGPVKTLPLYAQQVSCPQAGKCVVVGTPNLSTTALAAVVISAGKVGVVHKLTFSNGFVSPFVTRLSCASPSSCEMVGSGFVSGQMAYFYGGLGQGAGIKGVHTITHNYQLLDIACPPISGKCYLAANNPMTGGFLFSVTIGGGSLGFVSNPAIVPKLLACVTLVHCLAVGTGGVGLAMQTLTGGQPGQEVDFSGFGNSGGFTGLAKTSSSRYVALAADASSNSTYVLSGSDP